jgi:hypothetical protein
LPWLDRLLDRRKRAPLATGYSVAPPNRFDLLTMPSYHERAFWSAYHARQRRQQEAAERN